MMFGTQWCRVTRIEPSGAGRYGDTVNDFAHGLAKKLGDGRPTGRDMDVRKKSA